jgi:hypothetical protein
LAAWACGIVRPDSRRTTTANADNVLHMALRGAGLLGSNPATADFSAAIEAPRELAALIGAFLAGLG